MYSENSYSQPRYTMRWLGLQILYILLVSFILAMLSLAIDGLANHRFNLNLISSSKAAMINSTVSYTFAVIAITLSSVMLIELKMRKTINFLQYILIAAALWLFNLLLLALSEYLYFIAAYAIVMFMTIGLISWFIKGVTGATQTAITTALVLGGEYLLLLWLTYMGSMELLIGSLLLFGIIALAMYFTLKIKVEDDEIKLQ